MQDMTVYKWETVQGLSEQRGEWVSQGHFLHDVYLGEVGFPFKEKVAIETEQTTKESPVGEEITLMLQVFGTQRQKPRKIFFAASSEKDVEE